MCSALFLPIFPLKNVKKQCKMEKSKKQKKEELVLKKYFIFTMLCLAIVGISACGKNTDKNDSAKEEKVEILPGGGTNYVYVITKGSEDELSAQVEKSAGSVIEKAGYIVKAYGHEGSEEKQTKYMKKAIDKKAAAILCDPAGTSSLKEEIREARKAKIPVFLLGEDNEAAEEADAFFLIDRKKAAEEITAVLAKETGKSGVYAVVGGEENAADTRLCKEGFEEKVEDSSLRIAVTEYTGEGEERAQNAVSSILKQHEEVNGILCINDSAAIGAAKAIQKAGLEDKVYVVSVGGSNAIKEKIQKGKVLAAYVLPASDAGKKAGKQIVSYLTDKKNETRKLSLEGFVMTKENAKNVKNYQLSEKK